MPKKFSNLQEAMQAWIDGDDFPPAPAIAIVPKKAVVDLGESLKRAYSVKRRIA